MAQGIFLIQNEGSLVELAEEEYDSELILQDLLAQYPKLLSGDRPLRWLFIKREVGIPDSIHSGNRWNLDHLFLDQDGIPTFVEVKRSRDTRIRREVVGQMLEYAANAIVYWPLEKIQAEIETMAASQETDPDSLLLELLGDDCDVSDFWQKVRNNLSSGRVRLIFVADFIPRELQRIVEFLNQQMSPAEVYAVEVKQYVGQGIKSLVPRVVGMTVEAEMKKSAGMTSRREWDKDSFLAVLEDRSEQRELSVAKRILEWAESKGLRIAWGSGSSDGSYYPMLDLADGTHYTFAVRTGWKKAYIQLQFAYLTKPFDTLEKKRELAEKIQKATGRNIPDDKLDKYPGIYLTTMDPQKVEDFLAVFDWYIEECKYSEAQTEN